MSDWLGSWKRRLRSGRCCGTGLCFLIAVVLLSGAAGAFASSEGAPTVPGILARMDAAKPSPTVQTREDLTKLPAESAVPGTERGIVGTSPAPPIEVVLAQDRLKHEHSMTKEKYRLYLCFLLVIAALGSLWIVLRSLGKTCSGAERMSCAADRSMHASALVFIIFGTLLLTIIVDKGEQITAAIGVLGAVAGYLFGSARRDPQVSGSGGRGGP